MTLPSTKIYHASHVCYSLVLLARLQALQRDPIHNPPCLRDQLMQLRPELSALRRIVLLPLLHALERGLDMQQDAVNVFPQRFTDFGHDLGSVLLCPARYVRERTCGAGNGIPEEVATRCKHGDAWDIVLVCT
jgi:hypothetical protein